MYKYGSMKETQDRETEVGAEASAKQLFKFRVEICTLDNGILLFYFDNFTNVVVLTAYSAKRPFERATPVELNQRQN